MRFSFALIFFFFVFLQNNSAQEFNENEAKNVLNQLKREQQLIKFNNTIALDKKALLLTQFGLLKEAHKLIEEQSEGTYEWLYTSALFYVSIKQYTQALSLAKKAYEIQPNKREVLILLGEIYLNTLEIKQALQIAETRLAEVDFDDKAFVLKAKANMITRNFIIAKKYVSRAIDINKNNAEAWFVKAQIEKNEKISFLKSITNCLKLNPYHSEARLFLASYLQESDSKATELNCKIALIKEPFNTKVHQFLLAYHQNESNKGKLQLVNQTLDGLDVELDDAALEKEIKIVKDIRARVLSKNVKDNVLDYAIFLERSELRNVLFHTSYLELIYAGKVVDKLGIQNLNELSVFKVLNNSDLQFNANKLFEYALDRYSSVGQLLKLSDQTPQLVYISISENDYPFYKLFDAFFDNKELIAQLGQNIYEQQMPLSYQRNYRKWAMECHKAKMSFKEDMFQFLLNSDKVTSCDSMLIFFNGLSDILQRKKTGINEFRAEAYVQNANQLMFNNEFLVAEPIVQKALKEKARYNTALLAQSKLSAALGRYEEAKLWLQTAIETTPNESEIYRTEGLLSLINFEKGKITSETAFNEISIAFAKAISVEKDLFIFGKLNREIQDILKLFGKYKEGLQLAEAYLSQKANKFIPYERHWLEETKAYTTSIRVSRGFHKKNLTVALELIQNNKDNSQINDMLWLAFNQTLTDSNLIRRNKISLQKEISEGLLKKQKVPLQIESYYYQLFYLQRILVLIDEKEIEKATNALKAIGFSKVPEVWSNYQYVRSKLFLANNNKVEASNTLFSSIATLPSNFKSLSLLKTIKTSAKNKVIKRNYKKGHKIVQKLNIVPGPYFNL